MSERVVYRAEEDVNIYLGSLCDEGIAKNEVMEIYY